MHTTIFLKIFIHINFFSTTKKQTLHLINSRKIGAPKELSSLVKLNVNFIQYLSVILLTYINKITLYLEIDFIKSTDLINKNTTLLFSKIGT